MSPARSRVRLHRAPRCFFFFIKGIVSVKIWPPCCCGGQVNPVLRISSTACWMRLCVCNTKRSALWCQHTDQLCCVLVESCTPLYFQALSSYTHSISPSTFFPISRRKIILFPYWTERACHCWMTNFSLSLFHNALASFLFFPRHGTHLFTKRNAVRSSFHVQTNTTN